MQDEYRSLDGSTVAFDLDDVVQVAKGYSQLKKGWHSFIVYDVPTRAFIELRSSPPDYKGNSADEVEEVTEQYVCATLLIEPSRLSALRASPRKWQLVNRRV
ncbi:hypothetical protein GCM10007320_55450 [Pseudorhodoferax aquiterrae]|uniref:Uncharacterized protein n=2 Tax=Pseudorhodoferax aquiterrae TaxID=747304 RepID=A0ABQ3GAT2_9BURK|nr:hypothetical protein GCM10007320_55450 [Pseudorhodoferax aquiterrae]